VFVHFALIFYKVVNKMFVIYLQVFLIELLARTDLFHFFNTYYFIILHIM